MSGYHETFDEYQITTNWRKEDFPNIDIHRFWEDLDKLVNSINRKDRVSCVYRNRVLTMFAAKKMARAYPGLTVSVGVRRNYRLPHNRGEYRLMDCRTTYSVRYDGTGYTSRYEVPDFTPVSFFDPNNGYRAHLI